MKTNIKPCLEQHLPEKAKAGNAVPAEAWFAAAEAHLLSAGMISDVDPSGAFILGWASMHKTAKGIAAIGGCRLEGETHGKVVDFICCVFADLTNLEKGLVRAASTGRNALSYDDPRVTDRRTCGEVLALATRLLAAARGDAQPKPVLKIPPPPPKV
jgi:hypothetical protein